ncbi:putative pseudopilin GspG-like [Candidatus Gastranaerophilus sp. (ex Termes propinquus)]|nr:putative pseudopilin GspG-like [Candidatus Gastranaerophilus sp. (ex Termes propinquus)]
MLKFSLRESKGAFTLAEVLITLAVVGIVAASTIPAVVTKLTRQEYVTKLQKAHNTLVSVVRAAEKDHGPMQYWNHGQGSDGFFNMYFKPYLEILADCGGNAVTYGAANACFAAGGGHKSLNNGTVADLSQRVNNRIARAVNGGAGNHYRVLTSDGIAYAVLPSTAEGYTNVIVDVNGNKAPNQVGRDIFLFDIFYQAETANNNNPVVGVKPAGSAKSTGALVTTTERDSSGVAASPGPECCACNTSRGGGCCAAKVLTEGAMNY